jgi:hypothetical protein
MGKQVNFYMLEEDEEEFVSYLLDQAGAVLIGAGSLDGKVPFLKRLPAEDAPPAWRDHLYLSRPGYPVFMQRGIMRAGPLQGREVSFVDELDSSVIEFTRSGLVGDRLTRGRIWAEMTRLEGDRLVYKGEEFEKWYDRIAAWVRRHCPALPSAAPYRIGRQAYAWRQAGGMLQP